jgi:hypothetical protein
MKNQTVQQPFIFLLGFVLFSTLGLIGCSSAVPLTSDWKTEEIIIDGKSDDWNRSLYDLKKANVTIGFHNDAENLYVCFISYDQSIKRQIMSGGFTVWFDPSGGTDEKYGIKFPVGLQKGARPMNRENAGGVPQMPGNTGDDDNNLSDNNGNDNRMPPPMPGNMDTVMSKAKFGNNDGKMPPIFNNALREIQFLGPDEKDVQQATTVELKTMKVQVGLSQKAFVYELQVPLQKTGDFPFALAPTGKKNILGVGFKTEDNFSGGMGGPGNGPGGPPPGGGPGGGSGGGQGGPPPGRGPGRSGGARGGKESNSSEPIEVWTQVTLAHK